MPNMEIYRVFGKMMMGRFDNSVIVKSDAFCNSIRKNDADGIFRSLSSLMVAVLSSRVLDHEHSYQAFTVGILLKLHGAYSMYADGERTLISSWSSKRPVPTPVTIPYGKRPKTH